MTTMNKKICPKCGHWKLPGHTCPKQGPNGEAIAYDSYGGSVEIPKFKRKPKDWVLVREMAERRAKSARWGQKRKVTK